MGRPRPHRLAHRARHAAAAVLALAALPAGSSAATVETVSESFKAVPIGERVIFRATAGEANRVASTSVQLEPTGQAPQQRRWTFKDTSTPLNAGAGCVQLDASTVTCTVDPSRDPLVELGDGDDELDSDTPLTINAGDGDDTIRLTGDVGASSGLIDAGDGDDLVDASLARAVAVTGGHGGDLLIGSDFADDLVGGPGNDELRGGKENDRLVGNAGADKYTCGEGSGDDALLDFSDRLLDPDTPTLALGPLEARGGREARRARAQAAGAAGRASLKSDCERVTLPTGSRRTVRLDLGETGARLAGGVLTLGRRLSAPRPYDVQLRDTAGKLLGRGSLKAKTVRVRLTPAGTKALRPGARKTLRLRTAPSGSTGGAPKSKPGVQVDITVPKADES